MEEEEDSTPPPAPRLLHFPENEPSSPGRINLVGARDVIDLGTPSPRVVDLSFLCTPPANAVVPVARSPYPTFLELLGSSVSPPAPPKAAPLADTRIPPPEVPSYLAPKASAKRRPKGRPANTTPAEPKRAPKFC